MAAYDYPAFIQELRELDAEVPVLMAKPGLHKDADFQRWRHALVDAVQRIEGQDYDIHCAVEQRGFGRHMGYGPSSPREQQHYYQTDLGQTQIELRQLIGNFEKYGDPRPRQDAAAAVAAEEVARPARLEPPARLTAKWIWEHMPGPWWVWTGGILASTFMLGIGVGHSKLYADLTTPAGPVLVQHDKRVQPNSSASAPRPKAASSAH
ncbi:hypothetical protein [Chromobacterium vaccinii]|uniref:hypothetical protein n=1 Tax=Chromobacterium vaccinii TaxID=1108595 RepID=UPI003457C4EE